LKVPVGKATLGRLFNVLGEAIDDLGKVEAELGLSPAAVFRGAIDGPDPRPTQSPGSGDLYQRRQIGAYGGAGLQNQN
jgi:hypothetical protein